MLIDNIQHIRTAVKFENSVGVETASPLGIYYEIKFPKVENRKIINYWRQDILQEVLPNERVSFCMRNILMGDNKVNLMHNKEYMKAHYGNLMVCGSIWICPVCSSKISERRKEELKRGFEIFSGGFIMVTFTLKHANNEKLKDVLGRLDRAYKLITHGRFWQDFKKKYKILGSVSNLEITYGSNGWHPHKHVVYLVKNEFVIKEFEAVLSERWLEVLGSSGGSGLSGIALKCELVTDYKGKVAEYLAENNKMPKKESWGIEAELTKSYIKSSKNFWSIVDDFIIDGKLKDLSLILEYAQAIKGRRSVVMSRGLRKYLLIEDKSDYQIATEKDKKAELLMNLSRDIWKVITIRKKRGELLKVASNGDLNQINEFLNNLM